jgi:hypothetical protein
MLVVVVVGTSAVHTLDACHVQSMYLKQLNFTAYMQQAP